MRNGTKQAKMESLESRQLFAIAPVASEAIDLTLAGRYSSGIVEDGATEISAYDSATKRLFTVNASASTVDILDLANPATPTKIGQIDLSSFGSPNSVAVRSGVVAVAVQAANKTDAGRVYFFDTQGTELSNVNVGALPDMLTFTPDGKRVLVANEGEPNSYGQPDSVDPEGSVSIINMRRGAANVQQKDVKTATFVAFNAQIDALRTAGVRIFGPGATVAQDVEPEYIAVSPDGKSALVTLQENNAVARIDIARARVRDIVPLGLKDHNAGVSLQTFEFENLPVLGRTAGRQTINLGGFSGLYFDGVNARNGRLQFITHTDRGPNADPIDTNNDGVTERPFALPNFTPEWVRFEVDPATGQVSALKRIKLRGADGKRLTGLANREGAAGLANADEIPIDVNGNTLSYSPFGGDFEGVVKAPDGSYWMADEYRPSIYHFDAKGKLIDRFVPEGSNAGGVTTGTEALPAVFGQRRANRGFEAIAYQDGKVYAFIQSPIDNPDVADDASSKASANVRILEFDPATGTTTGQYVYELELGGSDKIGDAVAIGGGRFLVLERDDATGPSAQKKVFTIDLSGATNINGTAIADATTGVTIESLDTAGLASNNVTPVSKTLYVDLVAAGYEAYDKPEGLALVDNDTIAVINDNDFGLAGGLDPATGQLEFQSNPPAPALVLVDVPSNGLDPSNEDGGITIANQPVFGQYLPDAIASYTGADGDTYYITANEGDAREYDGFDEQTRGGDLTLDPTVFPNAAALQDDAVLGRIRTSTATGGNDTDGDGDADRILSFGARSFTIWNDAGQIVFDSGDALEQITAEAFPDDFNADEVNDSFDDRSDDKGPEPEGVTTGVINGRTYAFVGLERIGGIVIYDVTDPKLPQFVNYVNTRDFEGADIPAAVDLAPEGILFIPADQSPTANTPLLVVSNEVSGTIAVFNITQAV